VHGVEDRGVLVGGEEGDRQALGAEATGSAHAMEVGVGAVGHVVVDDDVDALDVDAACDEVGRDEDALVTLLERFVPRQALLLRHAAVDGDGRKVALGEELVEVRAALHGLDEDDHLVEHERVEEIVELAVLLRLGQLDVVLDEAVEGEVSRRRRKSPSGRS